MKVRFDPRWCQALKWMFRRLAVRKREVWVPGKMSWKMKGEEWKNGRLVGAQPGMSQGAWMIKVVTNYANETHYS